jgi:hypothetical protein
MHHESQQTALKDFYIYFTFQCKLQLAIFTGCDWGSSVKWTLPVPANYSGSQHMMHVLS